MIAANITSSTIFFVCATYLFSDCLNRKYKDSILYKFVISEGKRHPYRTSILIRLLYFPIGYKNTVLPLSGMKYWQYIIMSILHNLLIGGVLVLAGYHLEGIDELLNPKNFAEKDFF